MQPIYKHTQTGLVLLALLIVPTLGFTIAVLLASRPVQVLPLAFVLAFMLFTIFTFRSLTVQVDGQQVRLYFGLGFPKHAIALEKIHGVREVRNSVMMGLGIHFIPRGMIYNVSGLDGVQLLLKDGREVRIGTDEPVALAAAIREALGAAP